MRADVERMRQRQVVAVFQREFGGARDARHGADKAGGGKDRQGVQGRDRRDRIMVSSENF